MGSSRTRILGLCRRARARDSRRCWPPLRRRTWSPSIYRFSESRYPCAIKIIGIQIVSIKFPPHLPVLLLSQLKKLEQLSLPGGDQVRLELEQPAEVGERLLDRELHGQAGEKVGLMKNVEETILGIFINTTQRLQQIQPVKHRRTGELL